MSLRPLVFDTLPEIDEIRDTDRIVIISGNTAYYATHAALRGLKGDKGRQGAAGNAVVNVLKRRQALKALRLNTTSGVNWLAAVQAAVDNNESSDDAINYMAWEWPAGGAMWLRVQAILNSALVGGFTAAQRQALETQAGAQT